MREIRGLAISEIPITSILKNKTLLVIGHRKGNFESILAVDDIASDFPYP